MSAHIKHLNNKKKADKTMQPWHIHLSSDMTTNWDSNEKAIVLSM